MAVDLVICAATEMECGSLRARLNGTKSIEILRTGVGPVSAAHALTWFLAKTGARAIISCGVGGAYPQAGLAIGEVVSGSSECYGDLGVAAPTGFLDMKALGFPVVEGDAPLFNEIPLDIFPTEHRVPFITVSSCSGTEAAAREIAARTGGAVENMEGAAIAHVGRLHHVPVGAIRGISNFVSDRDLGSWRLKEAADAAQDTLLEWILSR